MTIKEHWRIEKRRDVSEYGKDVISKVEAYEKTWISRCYVDGIPDELPDALMVAGLAPSWRAVAMAILLNRFALLGIYPRSDIFFTQILDRENSQMYFTFSDTPEVHEAEL